MLQLQLLTRPMPDLNPSLQPGTARPWPLLAQQKPVPSGQSLFRHGQQAAHR
jgi:hypothetical protein